MIRVNYIGAMGNQLFEYAYARALSEEFADKDIVINKYFNVFYEATVGYFSEVPNELLHLRLNKKVREITRVRGMLLALKDFIPYAFDAFFRIDITREKYKKRTERGKYRLCRLGFSHYEHCDTAPKNKVVTGLFQCGGYFAGIRPILLEEFKVKEPPSEENARLLKEIASCNSVAVHVRRGDYLLPKFAFLNICGEDYYRRAMKYIAEHTENPVFYVFSNTARDVEWIRNNWDLGFNIKYVTLNNPVQDDFRLMYSCKHFVMSNSTLSWWASYMIENDGKIVVVPEKWHNKDYGGSVDIYRDDMLKIPADTREKK